MMKSPSFRLYVLLSFVVHALVVGTMYFVDHFVKPIAPNPEAFSIDLLTTDQLEQFAQLEKNQPKKTYAPNNLVVEQDENQANDIVPDNARYLSAKNQKVEKQTVAKNRGDFQNLKKPAAKTGPKGDGRQKTAPIAEENRQLIEKDLFAGFNAKTALEKQQRAETESGLGQGRGNGEQNTGQSAEASQSNDYIKDADAGLETLLNTREFKYYSYYTRIRKQLAQHWEGRVRFKLSKLYKEGRAPAATSQDRITKVMIILNDAGTLVGVQVLSDSGIRDLDDAAVEAFRAAAPFPNPPKGIVEKDGTVKIRWDFVLEV